MKLFINKSSTSKLSCESPQKVFGNNFTKVINKSLPDKIPLRNILNCSIFYINKSDHGPRVQPPGCDMVSSLWDPVPQLCSVICNIHLCGKCKTKHLIDKFKKHTKWCHLNIVSLLLNVQSICLIFMNLTDQLNIPIFATSVSSQKHYTHGIVDIFQSV